jgi:hypothetical protein
MSSSVDRVRHTLANLLSVARGLDDVDRPLLQGQFFKYGLVFLMGMMVIGMPVMVFLPGMTGDRETGIKQGRCLEACAAKEMWYEGHEKDRCLCRSPYHELVRTSTHAEPERPLHLIPFRR